MLSPLSHKLFISHEPFYCAIPMSNRLLSIYVHVATDIFIANILSLSFIFHGFTCNTLFVNSKVSCCVSCAICVKVHQIQYNTRLISQFDRRLYWRRRRCYPHPFVTKVTHSNPSFTRNAIRRLLSFSPFFVRVSVFGHAPFAK
jgi:hypothetical protein